MQHWLSCLDKIRNSPEVVNHLYSTRGTSLQVRVFATGSSKVGTSSLWAPHISIRGPPRKYWALPLRTEHSVLISAVCQTKERAAKYAQHMTFPRCSRMLFRSNERKTPEKLSRSRHPNRAKALSKKGSQMFKNAFGSNRSGRGKDKRYDRSSSRVM